MTTRRLHPDPRGFGRRHPFVHAAAIAPAPVVSDDLKLFLMTWAAGFVVASIFLA